MKLLSKVGALHTLPKPSSAVMDAALGLLTAFGDPQKLKKLLVELRDVQAHNEQVLKDSTTALADLGKREEKLGEEQIRHERETTNQQAMFAGRAHESAQREHRLATRISTFDKYEKAETLRLTERKAELDKGMAELTAEVKAWHVKGSEITAREAKLNEVEQKLNATRTRLKAREAKLRAALDDRL